MKAAPMKERPAFPLMKQTDIQSVFHLQMPRWLFTDPDFRPLSLEAKVVYTFLLNRFQLSRLNGWTNDSGEVFIIYTRASLAEVNPHALRHTFATKLVNDNVPLTIVKGLMGHASITTTQIYTHKDKEVEREAITGFTNCLNMNSLANAPRKKMKFADVDLPHFAQ